MLEHGGQVRAAAAQYGIPLEAWLDLSTGINPLPYSPPAVPPEAWARLPQEQDGLEQAAADCYGTSDVLAVAGSQAALQALPRLRARSRVGVLHPGYTEHAHAWRAANHEVLALAEDEIPARLDALDVLVVMNPNNPTGATFFREGLLNWHQRLARRGGWLVVDEAFIDATPLAAAAAAEMPEGLVVLRSLGKFFGLAGARVGFVLAHAALRAALREALGPWAVAGPSRAVAAAALRDRAWQEATRARLARDSERLARLLTDAGLAPAGGCALFQRVVTGEADALHHALATRGVLTRRFSDPPSLRFGLPGSEAGWQRLQSALGEAMA
jgi:cobalamin biosynthesis protein CobC